MDIQTKEPPKIEEKKCCLLCCSCSGWKVIVCVIVGLLILAGAVYVGIKIGKKQVAPPELIPIDNGPVLIEVSPTPEVPADWKTYRNEKYAYELRYPPNWFLESMPADVSGGVDTLTSYRVPKTQVKEPEFWEGKFNINIGKFRQPKLEGQSFGDWLTEYEKSLDSGLTTTISIDPVRIARHNTLKKIESYKADKDAIMVTYYIEKDSQVYFISGGGDFSQYQQTFDLVLSTFKFLD